MNGVSKKSDNPSYSEKGEHFMGEKNAEIKKQSHAYQDYASTYSIGILSSFNSDYCFQILNIQLQIS